MTGQSRGFTRRLQRGATLSLLALLAACGTATPPTPTPTESNGYLLDLKITAQDTQAGLEQKYGGKIMMWQPEMGVAIMQMSDEAKAALIAKGTSYQGTIEPNGGVLPPETVSLAGWSAWAGGWNTWAGGWNTWAGGWNTWAGGTGTYIPEVPGNSSTAFAQVSMQKAHMYTRNFGSGVKIAVIDTGLDLNHPMFSGRLAPSTQWKDLIDGDTTPSDVSGGKYYGHGTGVAGVILQVAPRATILPIRALKSDGSGTVANVIAGINHAINNGAKVINLSLGTSGWSDSLYTATTAAKNAGIFIVASAGNQAGLDTVTAPAMYSFEANTYGYVFGVASVNSSDILSQFSSYGIPVAAMAPGEAVISAYPSSQIASYVGTSFAAPIYSGAVALILADLPSTASTASMFDYFWNSSDAVQNLTTTARGIDWNYLAPRLNLENVLRNLPGWTEPALPNAGIYNLINVNSGKCLDVKGAVTTDGAAVQQYSCNGGDNQKWRLEKSGSYYKLTAVNSGKVLDVTGGSTTDGAKMQQWTFSGGTNQLWTLQKRTSSTFTLVSAKSGKCLDVPSSSTADSVQLQQWTCNNTNAQIYTLKPLF